MISVETRARKWGHSIGVVIPREQARRNRIKAGDRLHVLASKKSDVLKRMFGSFKFREPVEKIMKESDKLLYNE